MCDSNEYQWLLVMDHGAFEVVGHFICVPKFVKPHPLLVSVGAKSGTVGQAILLLPCHSIYTRFKMVVTKQHNKRSAANYLHKEGTK